MSARRKAIRQRDIASYGRRTPRFDFVKLQEEVRESHGNGQLLSLSQENEDEFMPVREGNASASPLRCLKRL